MSDKFVTVELADNLSDEEMDAAVKNVAAANWPDRSLYECPISQWTQTLQDGTRISALRYPAPATEE